jgi:hypothetical protein
MAKQFYQIITARLHYEDRGWVNGISDLFNGVLQQKNSPTLDENEAFLCNSFRNYLNHQNKVSMSGKRQFRLHLLLNY